LLGGQPVRPAGGGDRIVEEAGNGRAISVAPAVAFDGAVDGEQATQPLVQAACLGTVTALASLRACASADCTFLYSRLCLLAFPRVYSGMRIISTNLSNRSKRYWTGLGMLRLLVGLRKAWRSIPNPLSIRLQHVMQQRLEDMVISLTHTALAPP
jgi:hypothetical protein